MRLIKFLLLLFTIASCYSLEIPKGYQPISVRKALSSPQILSFIQEGLKVIVEDAMKTKSIQRNNYNLSQINGIYRRGGFEHNYKFNCDFQNPDGSFILASFDVKYNPFIRTSSVTSYSFKIAKTLAEAISQNYVPLDVSEIIKNRNEIKKVVNFGLEQIVKRASWEGKIFANYPVYEVTSIKSVSKQISGRGIFYKCVINFTSNQNKNIETKVSEANFTVYYQPHQDKYFLLEFAVPFEKVYNIVESEIETSEIILKDIEDPFIPVAPQQASGFIVRDSLDFAVVRFINMNILSGHLPSWIKNVKKVEMKITGNGVFYKYDVELISQFNIKANASFIVHNIVTLNKKSVIAYSVQVQSSSETKSYSSPYNPFVNQENIETEPLDLANDKFGLGTIVNAFIEELELEQQSDVSMEFQ